METISNLLVLKDSSRQIARQTNTGQYTIDRQNIANHADQANRFLSQHADWGLIVVCSAARKLLAYEAWEEICEAWATHLERSACGYQVAENTVATTGLRHIFKGVKNGEVSIVNGHDKHLHEFSRHRDNDYLAADIIKSATATNLFGDIELGMFTNVSGVLDGDATIKLIEDISTVRHLAHATEDIGTTGGMGSKLTAADEALEYGAARVWLTNGRAFDALARTRAGEIGTTLVRTTQVV